MKELDILSRTEVVSNLYLGDCEDESDAKIFCVPDSEIGQQSAQNEQPQNELKGTMIRVLVENNFDRDYVCHMAIKVSRSTFTTAMCKCTIITLLDDSNLNAFQTFWPRLNILRLLDVPKIIDDCNFRSADSRVSLSNFSFN